MVAPVVTQVLARLQAGDASADDGALLESFLDTRTEKAFAALVQRHGPMVLAVCRRMLKHAQDVEDAYQATFLVLVRKAATIRPRHQVGNWLHGVAYRTALEARATTARRRTREQSIPAPEEATLPAQVTDDWRPIFDEELQNLPDRQRAVIILCDLEGRCRSAAARLLGIPEGTVSSRLARARQQLARRLTKRGITLSASALALAIAQDVAAHSSLASQTVSCAGLLHQVPAHILQLADGVLKAWLLTKLKQAGLLLLCLTLVGSAIGWLVSTVQPARAGGQEETALQSPPPSATAAQEGKPADAQLEERTRSRCQELLREALALLEGQPVADRELRHRAITEVAEIQAALGDRMAALQTLQRAQQMIDGLSEENKVGEYRWLAKSRAQIGDVDGAIEVVAKIPDAEGQVREGVKLRGRRDGVYQEVALVLARRGQEEAALRACGLTVAERRQGLTDEILVELAHYQARAGKFEEAHKLVDRITTPSAQIRALVGSVYFNPGFQELPNNPGIALHQAAAGNVAEAKRSLERATDLVKVLPAGREVSALTALACAHARLDDFTGARQTVEKITRADGRRVALAALACAFARKGRNPEALAIASAEMDPASRGMVYTYVGMGMAQAGDRPAARAAFAEAANQLKGLGEQDLLTLAHNLASTQAGAGEYEGALATAQARKPGNDAITLSNIAAAQARRKDFAAALRTVEQMDSEWWQGNTYRSVAKSQAANAGEAVVRGWSDQLPATHNRANALIGIAEGLAGLKR